MKSNLMRSWLAIAVLIACGSASTRAQELKSTAAGPRTASYSQSASNESGAIRAAFLQDGPAATRAAAPLSNSSASQGSLTSENGTTSITDTNFELVQHESFITSDEGCATCTGSSACNCEMCQLNQSCEGPGSVYYAEVQTLFLRAHVLEDAVGKLSEQYDWSPRVVAGYENAHGVGARARWWHYSQETPILGSNDDIQFQFDTIDLEATARFAMRKADLLVSGGARWAEIEIGLDGDSISTGAPGLTFAADLRTEVCSGCNSQWAAIGGGRISTLGGDWEGSSSGFLSPVRDDNIVVQEIYAGVEYTRCTKSGHSLYARLTFELQNWHSDAAAQDSGADSIGFVGPGFHAGASF